MAWMTCCPSCRTTFHVAPEQLTQAGAWLRCGHCDRVFDSTGLVVHWQEPLAVLEPSALIDGQAAIEPALPPSSSRGLDLWFAALGLLVLVPVLLLLPQRQSLLERWPQLWPAWQQACAVVRCEVQALTRAQDVVIDTSSFLARGDGYALTAVLRNVGSWPVRPPALELTLLNVQEQPVLRRVLKPEQLQWVQVLAPEQAIELRLDFMLDATMEPVTSYRLRSIQP